MVRNRKRGPDTGILSETNRGHMVAFSGELVGTILFLYFGFGGTQIANNLPNPGGTEAVLYISLSFGFSLAVTAWAFYRISGGLFNPAVRVM